MVVNDSILNDKKGMNQGVGANINTNRGMARSGTMRYNKKMAKQQQKPIKLHNFYLLKTAQTLIDQTLEEMEKRILPEDEKEKSIKN